MSEEGKVHIGNLPYRVTEDDIRDAFEKYGHVSDVNIITDRDTGRAKGFAFVTFEQVDDAQDAIDALHNTELGGRNITVNKARPREKGGGGGGRSYRSGGGRFSDRGSGYGGGGGYGGGRRYNDYGGGRRDSGRSGGSGYGGSGSYSY